MNAVKLVLEAPDGSELELGPFSQGVAIEHSNVLGDVVIIDIATRNPIAYHEFGKLRRSGVEGLVEHPTEFARFYVQAA